MRLWALLAIIGAIGLCCDDEESYPEFELISVSFRDGGIIPRQHTCFGTNVSPPLVFSDVEGDVESFAIIMDEPDALGGAFIHWMIWGIPKTVRFIGEDYAADIVADQNPEDWDHIEFGPNSNGDPEYTGPCPRDEEEHTYRIRVFALDTDLEIETIDELTAEDLISAMKGKIVGVGELFGVYAR